MERIKPILSALVKLAGHRIPEPHHQEFLDEHFSISPKWREFQKNLKSKKFVDAVKQDTRADEKLKRFSESIGKHKQEKNVPTYSVPSQSSGRMYSVKYHPDVGRYSCNCGDWTYAKSWRTGKKTRDCKHVRMVQLELKAQGAAPMVKESLFKLAFMMMKIENPSYSSRTAAR